MKKYDRNYEMQMYKTEEEQLKAIQQEGVNKVMKQMIEKYLLPSTSNNGIKYIHIHEDNQYFDKMVMFMKEFHCRM